MKDELKELEKKYEELGKEIERLKKVNRFKEWHYYRSTTDGIIILCDGKKPFGGYDSFSGIVISEGSWELGKHSDSWNADVFIEVKPTWEPV